MRVLNALEFLSRACSSHITMERKKKKVLHTVELRVRMDCDGCELKVKKALSSLKGVHTVEINRKQQKVTVTGDVEPSKVLKMAKSTGNKAEMWPYIPYNLVTAYPYTAISYDKKAPPGFVRYVEPLAAPPSSGGKQEYQLATLFSDDNPNACVVM